ncbi:MAG: helix-turn-helix transcriptional regulator [Chloroflexota bacterium]
MAKAIGVDEMTVVNWEKLGGLPKRGYFKVKSLCELLGVDYGDLVARLCHPSVHDLRGFGARLRKARFMKGFTQEQAARLAGIDPGTLARWERSEQEPSVWMREKASPLKQLLSL